MRKVKRVKIGDFVLISHWGDKDPCDPWAVGVICEWGEDKKGFYYRVELNNRYYRHCWKISIGEGNKLIKERIEEEKRVMGIK